MPSFVDPAYCNRYHLNAEGRKNVEKILHVIRHVKPDITYCPVLYPLTSLLLHYMSDGMAFACIMKLLNDKQNYMSQTKADHTSSAYLIMKLTKKYAVSICLLKLFDLNYLYFCSKILVLSSIFKTIIGHYK